MKSQQFTLLLVLIGSVYVTTATLLSSSSNSNTDECSEGPTHWCANLGNAKKCNAVRHCIQTVWKQHDANEDKGPVCDICLKMATTARDVLKNNRTQGAIKAVFEGSCHLIMIHQIETECIKLADKFIPEIIELLASHINPQTFCSIVGLCNNEQIDNMIKESLGMMSNEDLSVELDEENILKPHPECQLCTRVVSEVEKHMGTVKTRDAIKNKLHETCGKMKGLARKCNKIIDKFGNEIAGLILSQMRPKQICTKLSLCSWRNEQQSEKVQERTSVEISKRPQLNGIVEPSSCAFCELVIKKLEDQVKNNKTAEKIKHDLEKVCKVMPKSLARTCDQFIIKYGNHIIAMLQTVPPKKICQNLKLCPKNSLDIMEDPIPCVICQYLVRDFKYLLTNNHSVHGIINNIENMCVLLPDSLAGDCNKFVHTYGNLVITLAQSLQPRQICQMLFMCPYNIDNQLSEQEENFDVEIAKKSQPNDITESSPCVFCELAVKKLKEKVKDNKTAEEIKHDLENICKILPKKLSINCNQYIETNGNHIIVMLQTLPPKQICQNLKLCPKNSSSDEINMTVYSSSLDKVRTDEPVPCAMCKFVVGELAKVLKDKTTVKEIIHIVENVCFLLPKNLDGNCNHFIETYGNVIATLAQSLPPKEICQFIFMCPHGIGSKLSVQEENSNLPYVEIP